MNIPSRLVWNAVRGGLDDGLTVNGGLPFADGGYDQIYVEDAARGIAMAAMSPRLDHAVYNVGSGGVPRYGEFADALRAAVPGCDIKLPVRPASEPPGATDGRWMSVDRIRGELGFKPEYDVATGVAGYVAWLRSEAGDGMTDRVCAFRRSSAAQACLEMVPCHAAALAPDAGLA